MILVLLAALEVVPAEIYEAAKIDGASNLQVFHHITVPMIQPVVLIALLIRTMDAFRAFDKLFVMTRGGPGEASETLNLYIWKTGLSWFRISEATAMAIIMLGLIIVLSQVFVKMMSKEGEL
jgi:multiple sugar transport system permease protein